MANAIKRIQWSRDAEVQDRILYYLFQKAKATSTTGTAAQSELDLAGRVYGQTVNLFAACMVCATNTTIGAAIDADASVVDNDIEYVVVTDQWANMAAAGV
jgi:hypothetical protein